MNNPLWVLVFLLPEAINFEHWLQKGKKKLRKFCSLDLKPGNCLAAWDTAIFPIFPVVIHVTLALTEQILARALFQM